MRFGVLHARSRQSARRFEKSSTRGKRPGCRDAGCRPAALHRMTGIRAQAAIATSGKRAGEPAARVPRISGGGRSRAARRFSSARTARSVKASTIGRRGANRRRHDLRPSVIVVATGYATPEFRGLVGRFRMKDTYVIATRRLPLRVRRAMPDQRRWRGTPIVRTTTSGGPTTGGCWSAAKTRTIARRKGSRRRIAKARARSDDLSCAGSIRNWPTSGRNMPGKGCLPRRLTACRTSATHSRYPRHLFALGYGGNGMTASFLAAQTLRRLVSAPRQWARQSTRIDANLFAFDRGAQVI